MARIFTLILLLGLVTYSCKTDSKNTNDTEASSSTLKSKIDITPISHGTLILEYKNLVIYVDPVGGSEAFKGQKKPDFILITDVHGDHLNIETLKVLNDAKPTIVVPIAVKERLTDSLKKNTTVVSNFQSITLTKKKVDLGIEGIPMYNLREEAKKIHVKDRGNGYVLTLGKERVYISGDTEDIPEMRNLKNIDIAFVCMNLPWTMTVDSAASAVLDFKPKVVYPYHYKGTEGLSDTSKFKELVNAKNSKIDVHLLNWYPVDE